MKLDDSSMIAIAREYLVRRFGISGTHTQFFMYLMEGEDFAEFRKMIAKGEDGTVVSRKIIMAYMKRTALLRKKAALLADMIGLSDDEDRECFITETMSRCERIIPLDQVKTERLQAYLEKVKAGMDVKRAMRALGLNPHILEFETIRESFDWED